MGASPLDIGEAIRTHHIKKLLNQAEAAKKPKARPETHLHGGKLYDNPVCVRRIRIYPTVEQKSLLVGWLGARRLVYNKGVALTKDSLKDIRGRTRELVKSETFHKDHAWIQECPNDMVDGAICDLHNAVASHFAKLKKLKASDRNATLARNFKFRSKRDTQLGLGIGRVSPLPRRMAPFLTGHQSIPGFSTATVR